MPNYIDTTKPQITASYFSIRRTGKALDTWEVEVREREYANVADGDADFERSAGGFSFQMNVDKIREKFPLVDPATLKPTDKIATYAQLFALVQSAYMHEARKRDEKAQEGER